MHTAVAIRKRIRYAAGMSGGPLFMLTSIIEKEQRAKIANCSFLHHLKLRSCWFSCASFFVMPPFVRL